MDLQKVKQYNRNITGGCRTEHWGGGGGGGGGGGADETILYHKNTPVAKEFSTNGVNGGRGGGRGGGEEMAEDDGETGGEKRGGVPGETGDTREVGEDGKTRFVGVTSTGARCAKVSVGVGVRLGVILASMCCCNEYRSLLCRSLSWGWRSTRCDPGLHVLL